MSEMRRAFTLVELLAVLAIVAILLTILIPTVSGARNGVARAQTKVMFNQWALACTQFRAEYGFLPVLSAGNLLATTDDTTAVVRILTGRNSDGSVVVDPATLGGNHRRLTFLTLAAADLAEGRLVDAFGNGEFGVVWDRDGDGWIRPGVDGTVVGVRAADGSGPFSPDATILPATGVRADIIFYSAGRGRSADDLVFSWR